MGRHKCYSYFETMFTVARKAIMLKTLSIHFDFTNRIAIDYFCPFPVFIYVRTLRPPRTFFFFLFISRN